MKTTRAQETTRALGLTVRSVLLGLGLTVLTNLWIHYAELIMSGVQGHSAIAATATPVGAVTLIFGVAGVNLLLKRFLPQTMLTAAEMLIVYVMVTTSTVLSSSGQLHFLVPTIVASFHYATDANAWASTFHRFVPHWLAQTNPEVLDGFYKGKTTPPWGLWGPQLLVWIGFLLTLTFATFCLVSLMRRQWVDREKLSFPTVALPLALVEAGTDDGKGSLFRNKIFWAGLALPFVLTLINTLALNDPKFPLVSLRADTDLAQMPAIVSSPPWNAMGRTPLSFYPFVIGVAYFIPVEVTFSGWFFFLLTRIENVVGAALNIDAGMTGTQRATFPFIGQQGAGAFLALALVPLWLARSYVKEVVTMAFGGPKGELDDTDEALSYRAAAIGLLVSVGLMIAFCIVAGMQPLIAALLVILALCYMVAATRIRAETGNAWLFGPEVDVNHMLTRTLGTGLLTPADLTVLAFMRPVLGNFDMRCLPMPHQLEALKMADSVGASRRKTFVAIAIATVIGLISSFAIALLLWHGYGAEAKTDAWRTSMGRQPFDNLVALLRNPAAPDLRGLAAIGFGFAFTAGMMFLRARFLWWPLHPVGYAMANTNTMTSTWLPFLIAWGVKILVLRYGGADTYKKFAPFFLGLIAGDLLGGGLTTAWGALSGINVYPINW
ncbi:OPT/YSL family transporter [Armatimonas rosea]|uniref:OPT family oligopeptide transporter n=1 Tax=Armatimonas rosea TaxID=685828 RepID=A0A7W9SMF7_ARMRO|nr:OPT/YSL family transporter [Armatimonas rosea]MBB6049325.1 hypothetical protein [Armatimonas rosea]